MYKFIFSLLVILFSFLSTMTSAYGIEKNSINFNFGYGSLSNKLLVGEFKSSSVDSDIASLAFSYRRMVSPNFGVELGYRSSFGGLGSMIISGITEVKDPSLYGPRIMIYGELPLNKYFGFHSRLGVNYTTLEYTSKQLNKEVSNSEIGGEGSIGFHFNILRFSFGVDYTQSLSRQFKSSIYSVGTSFKF
ncbi:hypothetical protein ACIMS1_004499 [Vibrio harveyi]